MHCDAIVISDAILRRVNLEMALLRQARIGGRQVFVKQSQLLNFCNFRSHFHASLRFLTGFTANYVNNTRNHFVTESSVMDSYIVMDYFLHRQRYRSPWLSYQCIHLPVPNAMTKLRIRIRCISFILNLRYKMAINLFVVQYFDEWIYSLFL